MTNDFHCPTPQQPAYYVHIDTMTRINQYTGESSPDSDSDDGEFDD